MRKTLSAAVIAGLIIATISGGPAMAATPKAGAKCTKAGITQIVKSGSTSTKFTCVKSGKKLVWNKGVKTVAKPSTPKPIASGEPNPATPEIISVDAVAAYKANGWAKPTSSAEVVEAATKEFAAYVADKKREATVNVVAQAGTPEYWIDWIKQGVTKVATTFEYPQLVGPYTAFIAKDVEWLKVEFTKV
jgi:hypothetical protein